MVSALVLDHCQIKSQLVEQMRHAIVVVRGRNGANMGQIGFRENIEGKVNIRGTVEGLVKGAHGMHIHQFGDLSLGCKSTGGHFDILSNQTAHGPYGHGHTGDFGNLIAGDTGVANIYINDSPVTLHGDASIVGRAIVIHEGPDDLGRQNNNQSRITGNSGHPVACGIIAWDD